MTNPFATSALMPPFPLDFGNTSNFNNNSNNNNNNSFLFDNSPNPFATPELKLPDSKGWQHRPQLSQQPAFPLLLPEKKKTVDMDIDICVACAECGSRQYDWSNRKEVTDPTTKETLIYCSVSCALHLKKMWR